MYLHTHTHTHTYRDRYIMPRGSGCLSTRLLLLPLLLHADNRYCAGATASMTTTTRGTTQIAIYTTYNGSSSSSAAAAAASASYSYSRSYRYRYRYIVLLSLAAGCRYTHIHTCVATHSLALGLSRLRAALRGVSLPSWTHPFANGRQYIKWVCVCVSIHSWRVTVTDTLLHARCCCCRCCSRRFKKLPLLTF